MNLFPTAVDLEMKESCPNLIVPYLFSYNPDDVSECRRRCSADGAGSSKRFAACLDRDPNNFTLLR